MATTVQITAPESFIAQAKGRELEEVNSPGRGAAELGPVVGGSCPIPGVE
jgi:hypothetical protein